jgi:phage terminase small subunit
MALRRKQQRFIEEYVLDFNATQAAIRAGYSRRTAREIGRQNMTKANILEALELQIDRLERKSELTAERAVQEIARLAFSDIRKLFTSTGALRPLKEIDNGTVAALVKMEVIEQKSRNGTVRRRGYTIRFYSKTEALSMAGRRLKLFTDKHEVSGPDGKPFVRVFEAKEWEEAFRKVANYLPATPKAPAI